MAEDCSQLIQRILDGEKEAFNTLVEKYQKRTHALAWKLVGDYHIAEEITQDVFVQVHNKLSTLKDPKRFDGWLYVITNRRCINWLRRKKPNSQYIQSLENISAKKIVESSYRHYELELLKTKDIETKREIVNELLSSIARE